MTSSVLNTAQTFPSSIIMLPDVLTWSDSGDDAVSALERRYCEVLGARLGEVLASICRSDPPLGARLATQVEAASDSELREVLLAPETSRRLVTQLHDFQDVKDHLADCFARGSRKRGRPEIIGELAGYIPVIADPPGDPRAESVFPQVQHVFSLVGANCPAATRFVKQVMRCLVLRVSEERDGFASNSPQGLVGQAVLTNGHLPIVDDVVLAEALVHESIHGFVGMSEAIGLVEHKPEERWLSDDSFYEGFSCTVSPWTGKALDLPTYLHACFVWWGLLHLWAGQSGTGKFDERRVRSRLIRAARGFVDGALIEPLRPHSAAINPTLVATLVAMGCEVDELLVSTGLDALVARFERVIAS